MDVHLPLLLLIVPKRHRPKAGEMVLAFGRNAELKRSRMSHANATIVLREGYFMKNTWRKIEDNACAVAAEEPGEEYFSRSPRVPKMVH